MERVLVTRFGYGRSWLVVPNDPMLSISSNELYIGANWIEDGKCIRIYTSEGQGLVLTVEEGHVVVDAAATAEINTYLVTKIMQQWDEEQASMDQEQIATANNAIPVLYGTSISPIGLYTVYLFG